MTDYIKKTIKKYDKIAEDYAKKIQDLAQIELLKKFASLLPRNGLVLDCGCAAGRDSRILKDFGFDVLGIDLSKELLKIAQKNNPDIKFLLADIGKLPFPKNYFDGLWVSAVFHHLQKQDMLPTLKEFYRVLKPDGVLFILTKFGTKKFFGKDKLSLGEKREFTLLTENDLEAMIKKTNFIKLSLDKIQDPIRKEVSWLVGFYRKN